MKKTISKIISLPLLVVLLFNLAFPSFALASDTAYYTHQDHLGSTVLITDGAGRVVSRQAYHPYGNTKAEEGSKPTEKQYTGQTSDMDSTGLYYYNARYYNPAIAKFTQPDTLGDGLNRYAYVANNPVNAVDPSGNMLGPSKCTKDEETGEETCQPGVNLSNFSSGNVQNYPEQQVAVNTIGDFFKNIAADILTLAGVIDLTPNSWGLRQYVSQEMYSEAQAGLLLPGPMAGVVGAYGQIGQMGPGMGQAASTVRKVTLSNAKVVPIEEIKNIFKQSSALQGLSKAFKSGSEDEMVSAMGSIIKGIKQKYGTVTRYATEAEIQKGLVNAGNPGSFLEKTNEIIFHPDWYKLPKQEQLLEFIHEVGATYIARNYGGKNLMPAVQFPAMKMWSTHYLDRLIRAGNLVP